MVSLRKTQSAKLCATGGWLGVLLLRGMLSSLWLGAALSRIVPHEKLTSNFLWVSPRVLICEVTDAIPSGETQFQ